MQLLIAVPLLLPLSISGCLPLYHALREANLERAKESVAPRSEAVLAGHAERSLSAGHTPVVNSIHFCGVCAFIKGMNGALVASLRELPPPSFCSSTLVALVEAASCWNTLHPVSRAPPAASHV